MRYGPNFKQTMDPGSYKLLPKLATYDGDAPDLQHLRGVYMKTIDVEKLVYAGELEGVVVEDDEGVRWRPWKGVDVQELDDDGNPKVPTYDTNEPFKKFGPRAMNTNDLFALGWCDAMLTDYAKSLFDEVYERERVGKSDKRREMFDRVMAALMG